MKIIKRQEIESLLQQQDGPAISIYMPISRIGDQQDALRYKNLLTQAEKTLIEQGMRAPEARALLEPEHTMVQDPDYWMHLGVDGLAVFLSENTRLHYPLPVSFEELLTVAGRFHIKPLIPLLAGERYLVLTLSRNNVRLFQGDRFDLKKLELPEDTPKSMAEALQYDDPQSQLQYHTQTASVEGKRGAMYHGHGVGIDEEKENLERYFQAIDSSLFPGLDDEGLPIILAGTEELHGVYKGLTRSRNILSSAIIGNVDELPPDELQRKARKIAGEYHAGEEKEAVAKFQDNLGGSRAVVDLDSVLAAAFDGRVETLFVAENEEIMGVFDPGRRSAILKDGDEDDGESADLLEKAVAWTFCTKGKIYIKKREEMPADSLICAQLRY